MLISDFDYGLPPELIAQEPLAERQASRMLVVHRDSSGLTDSRFSELPRFLRAGDVLVLNNTKVFPARLLGHTETGAKIEIFLVRDIGDSTWEALARPARRLRPGKKLIFDNELTAELVDRSSEGQVIVRFDGDADLEAKLDNVGRTPLPPYIKRDTLDPDKDRERYQTVFASRRGAIAAPTAGLHFTPAVLDEIKEAGIEIAEITLHVGYGTFEPVRATDLSQHTVSAESYEIDAATAEKLKQARRIVAVGTTSTRALEANLSEFGSFTAGSHSAELTIRPGYRFKAVDALLTNFHLPQSSLLVLTSTFGGHELIMDAYRHAVSEKYRFYSYGDCMLIV
jgi:S-adenosylmethionine:tRNA ribosyltransferase-isomerase